MIQEIYDYLLIRSHFLFDKELLISKCNSKESFKIVVDSISNIMQKEDYFLTSATLQENISDLIQKYRFDFMKCKEINDEVNFIIGRLNEYKSMNPDHKSRLVSEWLHEEYQARNLPYSCKTASTVLNAMANEHSLFMTICGYKLNDEGNDFIPVGEDGQYIEKELDIFSYLELNNVLISRYPVFFFQEDYIETALYNIDEIIKTGSSKLVLKYAKSTLKQLKKLIKEMDEVSLEMVKEKRLNN